MPPEAFSQVNSAPPSTISNQATGSFTNRSNRQVYYGAGNSLYAWSPLTNTHVVVGNNFPSYVSQTYCASPNNTGAIVVDLSDVPNSTRGSTPDNSYGFIRFRAVVDYGVSRIHTLREGKAYEECASLRNQTP